MKRIKNACLEQTIHFMLKEEIGHDEAVRATKSEAEGYKQSLDRKHTKYKIVEESTQPDGSIIMKIKKQYNGYDCGGYLD